MTVVSYPPTDKSYDHIHTLAHIRPILEPETRKLSSFMYVVSYPPTEHTHQYTPRKTINHKQTYSPIPAGSLHKQDKHDQEPVFAALVRMEIHTVNGHNFRSFIYLT